ncbi:unnamed protein product [Phyllotreta striolata]|uniref:Cytochrome P450 n=1 Tax=Phyllotreta striolata TaxID=444603 RepID=A0A9N9TL03_PHYSR|nr:unnamed protein product [Phyllotreta striolata]
MWLTNKLSTDLIIAFITLIIAAYFYIKHKYSYWKRKGVVQLNPIFPFGNFEMKLPKGIKIGADSDKFYQAFKKMGVPYGGVYIGLSPNLVVMDPDIVKTIVTKDFASFVDRGLYQNPHKPITRTLITQKGEDWKQSRSRFTAVLTSSKLRNLVNNVEHCKDDLINSLEKSSEAQKDVDVHHTLSLFITDLITFLVFGVSANSFKSETAEFNEFGMAFFQKFTFGHQLKLLVTQLYPDLSRKLNLSNIQEEINVFATEFVTKSVEYRRKNNVKGTGFLQMLMDAQEAGMDIDMNEMISQSFVFFAGGLETSSTTTTSVLYELSKNKELQDKARQEIISVKEKHGGKITYDYLMELNYIYQLIHEALRMYPLLLNIYRVCVQDYELPGTDLVIEKGTQLIFPAIGYHRDADLFPDPMKFDPSRFDDFKNTKYRGYMPFGEGPRNCVASRLGILQSKFALSVILENFEVSPSSKTVEPLELEGTSFTLSLKTPIYLKFKQIKK